MAKTIEELEESTEGLLSGSRGTLNKIKAMNLFLRGDDDAFSAFVDTLAEAEQLAIADLIREIKGSGLE